MKRDLGNSSFSTGTSWEAEAADDDMQMLLRRRQQAEEAAAAAARQERETRLPQAPPPPPALRSLREDPALDDLPWPGQGHKGPPAWMLEDEDAPDAGVTPPAPNPPPSPLSDYQREWNELLPKKRNPWHSMDETELRQLLDEQGPQGQPTEVVKLLQGKMERQEEGEIYELKPAQQPLANASVTPKHASERKYIRDINSAPLSGALGGIDGATGHVEEVMAHSAPALLEPQQGSLVSGMDKTSAQAGAMDPTPSNDTQRLGNIKEPAQLVPDDPGVKQQPLTTKHDVTNGTTVKPPQADRTWQELEHEIGKATVGSWREYPRTAGQAAANIIATGAPLTERDVRLLYSMFDQKYPGEENRPMVQPTEKIKRPLQPGSTVLEAAKPHHLLKDANAAFDEALSAYVASPVEWIVDGITGNKNEGFSYGPDHPWTKVLKAKPIYGRMRYGPKSISEWATIKDKEGTLDQFIGWTGEPGKRGLKWDEIADESPWYQPIKDAGNYATGSELKSSGSVNADIVITHVDHGNRTVTFEVNAYDELRAGSMSRIPGSDNAILKDNPMGPFLYTTPMRWKWTETVKY